MARTGRYVCRMTYHLHTAPLRQTALPRKGLPRRWLLMLALAMLLGATELAVRLGGAVDFPLYVVDDGIGYMVKPDQHGAFLNKNHWVFNERSMGVSQRWEPVGHLNLLLIGNSIIMGGNPYDAPDKLAPLLQARLGNRATVWPIATGGWTTVNESVYLQRNPDVVQANHFFVWEYMHGGLSQLSQARGEYVFPRNKPWCATCYLVRRYVLPLIIDFNTSELPPTGDRSAANLALFEQQVSALCAASGNKIPGILLFYPGASEYAGMQRGIDYVTDRIELQRIAASHGILIVDVAQSPLWNARLYRDGTHPTAEGNRVLAAILGEAVAAALPTPSGADKY